MSGFLKLVRFLVAIPVVSAAFSSWSVMLVMLVKPDLRQIGAGYALTAVVGLCLAASPVVVIVLSVIAFPTTLLLDLIGVHGWRAYALVGTLIGGASVFVPIWLTVGFRPPHGFAPATGTIGLMPGLVGGLYWWSAIDRYHDHRSRIAA